MANPIKAFNFPKHKLEVTFFRQAGFPQSLSARIESLKIYIFDILGQAIICGDGVEAPKLITSLDEYQQDQILENLEKTWKICVERNPLPFKIRIFKEMDVSQYKLKIREYELCINHLNQQRADQLVPTQGNVELKIASFNKADILLKLAMYYSGLPNEERTAKEYLDNGLSQLKSYCELKTTDALDRQTWLKMGIVCLKKIQLYSQGILKYFKDDSVIIQEGLKAFGNVIKISEDYQSVHYKWMLLQGLYDKQKPLPEDHLVCMKRMLEIHPDSSSSEWLMYAQLYGQELAKQKRYEEAITWFEQLKISRPHPVNDLYRGKIDDENRQILTSISHFESAQRLCSDDNPLLKVEVELWLLSAKIKHQLNTLQTAKEPPQKSEVFQIVGLFNNFCSAISSAFIYHSSEETSTYISFGELASSFCLHTYPQMADVLLKLQQFQFALYLHVLIIENFDLFVQKGVFSASVKTQVFAAKGTAYFLLDENKGAEEAFQKALELDPENFEAYQNLIGVYAKSKNFDELEKLWESIQSKISGIEKDKGKKIGGVLFNLGVAFCCAKDRVPQAQSFFRQSLEYDSDNWDTKLHLARALVVTNGEEEAKQLLIKYLSLSDEERGPFHAFSRMSYQIYFTLAGVSAICGDIPTANEAAIEAGITKFDSDETSNLQEYLKALKQKSADPASTHQEIRESILKMEFAYRVGSMINSQSIRISTGTFVGYHGTSNKFLGEFTNGIAARCPDVRQYPGKGFYITDDRLMASYFAMKKAKEVGGKAVLIKVYAKQGLVGERNSKFKEKQASTSYDFIQSHIDGFEKFSQSYIFENSLNKLQPALGDDVEQVEWTPNDYDQFVKKWRR